MSGKDVFKVGQIGGDACPEYAVDFIRQMYPTKTAECVASDTEIPAQTVRRWLEGVAKPSWVAFSRLILAYGPAFLVAVYPKVPAWLDEAHRRERQEALKAEQRRIAAQLAALEPQS